MKFTFVEGRFNVWGGKFYILFVIYSKAMYLIFMNSQSEYYCSLV